MLTVLCRTRKTRSWQQTSGWNRWACLNIRHNNNFSSFINYSVYLSLACCSGCIPDFVILRCVTTKNTVNHQMILSNLSFKFLHISSIN